MVHNYHSRHRRACAFWGAWLLAAWWWCGTQLQGCEAAKICLLRTTVNTDRSVLSYAMNVSSPPTFKVLGVNELKVTGHLFVATDPKNGTCSTNFLDWLGNGTVSIVTPANDNGILLTPPHVFANVTEGTNNTIQGHTSLNNFQLALYGSAVALSLSQVNFSGVVYFQRGSIVIGVPAQRDGPQLFDFPGYQINLNTIVAVNITGDEALLTLSDFNVNFQSEANSPGVQVAFGIDGYINAKASFTKDVFGIDSSHLLQPDTFNSGLTIQSVTEQQIKQTESWMPPLNDPFWRVTALQPGKDRRTVLLASIIPSIATFCLLLLAAAALYRNRYTLRGYYNRLKGGRGWRARFNNKKSANVRAADDYDVEDGEMPDWLRSTLRSFQQNDIDGPGPFPGTNPNDAVNTTVYGVVQNGDANKNVFGTLGRNGSVDLDETVLSPRNLRPFRSIQVFFQILNENQKVPLIDFTSSEADETLDRAPLVAPEEKSLRLWLIIGGTEVTPTYYTCLDEHVPEDDSRMSRAISLLPEEPPLSNVNLAMDWERDIILPLNSFIGAGAFGQVHRAMYKKNAVAVKVLVGKLSKNVIRGFTEEMNIMARINHKNIVRCYGGSVTPPKVFIVEELMECSLADLIHRWNASSDTGLPLHRVLEVASDIASGLWHLHPSILHRDLKPQNILLNSAGVAKIADFGIARMKAETYLSTMHLDVGTVAYMAPECFTSEFGIGDKSDCYSLGIIIWEMLTGQKPWAEAGHQMGIIYQVAQCNARPHIPRHMYIPDSLRRLLRALWRTNPRERPSSGDVLKRLTRIMTKLDEALATALMSTKASSIPRLSTSTSAPHLH